MKGAGLFVLFFAVVLSVVCYSIASAQDEVSPLERRLQELEQRVAALEIRVEERAAERSAVDGAQDKLPLKLKLGGYESREEAEKWDFGN